MKQDKKEIKKYLIFIDEENVGSELANRLRKTGHHVSIEEEQLTAKNQKGNMSSKQVRNTIINSCSSTCAIRHPPR
ncbi:hypothetical protein [Brevibacillus laterosporus]|uniref:hypothetical protein n=1 Tax=Brevibacillus laterosporus TaxID=1465 RepID=UPI003F58F124